MRFFAMGRPMMPNPMNPMVCAMTPPDEDGYAGENPREHWSLPRARRRQVTHRAQRGQGGLLRTPFIHVSRTWIDARSVAGHSRGFVDKTSKSARLPGSRLPATASMRAARAAPSVYASSAAETEIASSGAATRPCRLVRVTAAAMPTSGAFEAHGESEENAWLTPARATLANGRCKMAGSGGVALDVARAAHKKEGRATTQIPRAAIRAISPAARRIA